MSFDLNKAKFAVLAFTAVAGLVLSGDARAGNHVTYGPKMTARKTRAG